MNEKLKVSAGTIARTVVLFIALVNQALAAFGKNVLPFDDTTVYELVSLIITIGASIWAGWKNNSFTQAALIGDSVMKEIKAEADNEPKG